MNNNEIPPRWYSVSKDGMATLCIYEAEAQQAAKDADVLYPNCAPHVAVQLAPAQPAEPTRIEFPAHLRKMWSGGEVQAWLDEHTGHVPQKPTAKGSYQRYQEWKARQAAEPVSDAQLIEAVTKAILFEDCGNTEDWRDNTDLGEAAIKAYREHQGGGQPMGADTWAELHRLRAERGPSDGSYPTWKDAAVAERSARVKLRPDSEIVALAREGLEVYSGQNQNEHKVCAELVRLADIAQPADPVKVPSNAEIREVFLENGFTIKQGHDDLKPYVYKAARALLARYGNTQEGKQ